jgi:hypothetical protein
MQARGSLRALHFIQTLDIFEFIFSLAAGGLQKKDLAVAAAASLKFMRSWMWEQVDLRSRAMQTATHNISMNQKQLRRKIRFKVYTMPLHQQVLIK